MLKRVHKSRDIGQYCFPFCFPIFHVYRFGLGSSIILYSPFGVLFSTKTSFFYLLLFMKSSISIFVVVFFLFFSPFLGALFLGGSFT